MKRRSFFKLIGVSAFTSISAVESEYINTSIKIRECYVCEGDLVDYVGEKHRQGFMGGKIVKSIESFDGIGYPVTTTYNTEETYYDFELCNFRLVFDTMAPQMKEEFKAYNNIHSYVRTIRSRGDWEKYFGEDVVFKDGVYWKRK